MSRRLPPYTLTTLAELGPEWVALRDLRGLRKDDRRRALNGLEMRGVVGPQGGVPRLYVRRAEAERRIEAARRGPARGTRDSRALRERVLEAIHRRPDATWQDIAEEIYGDRGRNAQGRIAAHVHQLRRSGVHVAPRPQRPCPPEGWISLSDLRARESISENVAKGLLRGLPRRSSGRYVYVEESPALERIEAWRDRRARSASRHSPLSRARADGARIRELSRRRDIGNDAPLAPARPQITRRCPICGASGRQLCVSVHALQRQLRRPHVERVSA